MRFALFYHSLVSDWNHGNAHFLRGIVRELMNRGHSVRVYEPEDGWSRRNLVKDHGSSALEELKTVYPSLTSIAYRRDNLHISTIAETSDVVIVHEWNEPWLIEAWAEARSESDTFKLLFHDTHHRAVSDPASLEGLSLGRYDGVLAFGEVLRQAYLRHRWNDRVWTWHEAADATVFHPPRTEESSRGDVVWIGNWGDDERTEELETYLFRPVRELNLTCQVHGVRYPASVLERLKSGGITYRGWLPNYRVPEVFARHRVTVHVPRRYYAQALPGIPTIRPFEALACGIPLVTAPWNDAEHLFSEGEDYLVAHDTEEMKKHLRTILNEPAFAQKLARHGRNTILTRHTCGHRAGELIAICKDLGVSETTPQRATAAKSRAEAAMRSDGRA